MRDEDAGKPEAGRPHSARQRRACFEGGWRLGYRQAVEPRDFSSATLFERKAVAMAIELQTKPLCDQAVQPADTARNGVAPETRDLVQPLEEILARVGRDSQQKSRQYLDETTVPHGGE